MKRIWKEYQRITTSVDVADWAPEFDMTGVSVSQFDKDNGSPKLGDRIIRSAVNYDDKWLVNESYFYKNFEEYGPCYR